MDLNGYGNVSVDTTPPHYRPEMARCALGSQDAFSGWDTGDVTGNVATAWFHTQLWATETAFRIDFGNIEGDGREYRRSCIRFVDEHGAIRLMIGYTTEANFSSYDPLGVGNARWWFAKVDDLGVVTRIGPVFSAWLAGSPAVPEHLDVSITNYDVVGGASVRVYLNNVLVFGVD